MLWAMRLQLSPPRDANNCHALRMLHTRLQPHTVIPSVAPNTMHSATNQRRSSPVEAVLTGSRAALLGLVEIIMSPRWGCSTINQG